MNKQENNSDTESENKNSFLKDIKIIYSDIYI
jgi:hypothetical protein